MAATCLFSDTFAADALAFHEFQMLEVLRFWAQLDPEDASAEFGTPADHANEVEGSGK